MLLRVGSTGDDVKKLQELLGVDVIGKFGPKTEAAVKGWQAAHGLTPDGVVGDATWAKMFAPVVVPPSYNSVVINTSASFAPPSPNVSLPVFKLDSLKGHVPQAVIDAIPDTAARFGITTSLRLAHFLAQCGHESGGFKAVQENLNYGAKGLLGIFKKYFKTIAQATAYERKPEKIANLVYANRMGNGDEASGDGWKFRGRGYIQLTGKENYKAFDATVPEDIIATPDLVATKYALASAAFFFKKNNLWSICDKGSSPEVVTLVTKRVNGGTIGLADRQKHFKEYYNLLS
jgi:putative chitinase